MKNREFRTVFIIAAPRSGTNILRDLVSGLPGLGTWPCDEINYIWRHGNRSYPTDELPASLAREEVSRYIRRRFASLARSLSVDQVVEKTCANSLRVEFVDRIFPDSRFLFLIRDGRDATASAMRRWRIKLDLRYHLPKARFVPLSDLPHCGFQFLRSRLRRLLSRDGSLPAWGPRFEGMEDALHLGLSSVCALQWKRCVLQADAALGRLEPARVLRVRYEDFVAAPEPGLRRIAQFLGVPEEAKLPDCRHINLEKVGRWETRLSYRDRELITPILDDALRVYGYS